VEETQFEVESFISETIRRQSTLTLRYLLKDREDSGIVAPKKYCYEYLVCYVPIEAEKVQNLEDLQVSNWEQ
jgi:hypothetical protein